MATLSDFKTRLGKLPATKGLDADVLDGYIEKALLAFSEHNPENVLMRKVPVDAESDGFYDVPTDAEAVTKVLVHDTKIEIEFSVERDAATGIDKLRLGSIQRRSTIFIEGHYNVATDLGTSDPRLQSGYGRGVGGGYSHFDVAYERIPTIESLSRQDLTTVELYVEYLGFLDKASQTDNLVDITDADSSGDSTTLRRSNIGRQNKSLADMKKEEFDSRAIRPYASRDTTYHFQYYYRHIY